MKTLSTLSLTVGALLSCGAATAEPTQGSWETTFAAGADGIGREKFLEPDIKALPDIGAIDPTLTGNPATLTLDHLSFHDALRPGAQVALESGYWASPSFEPFVRLDYAHLRGKTADIGMVSSPALASAVPIGADFGNRDSESIALGSRYLFNNSGALQPFMAGFIGWTHQDALHANLEATGVGLAPEPALLLHAATNFDAGLEAGLSYGISDRADLRLSAGLDYLEGGKTMTTAFERFGLGPVALGAPHWSVPVQIGMSYRF